MSGIFCDFFAEDKRQSLELKEEDSDLAFPLARACYWLDVINSGLTVRDVQDEPMSVGDRECFLAAKRGESEGNRIADARRQ